RSDRSWLVSMLVLEAHAAVPRAAPAGTRIQPVAAAPSAVSTLVPSERLPFLDFLRVVSAHLIVWHHLVFYGPLSDVVAPYFPQIYEFLFEYGRYAVQVFFVLGGFVTAASFSRRSDLNLKDAAEFVKKRYWRIGGPYLAVLLVAVGANFVADLWMDHHSI